MVLTEIIFDYLKSKVEGFKVNKGAKLLFDCPNLSNHKYKSNNPTATIITGTNKIACLQCSWKGTIFDVVRLLEPEKKNKSDAEITDYLITSFDVDMYKELDIYKKYNWSLLPVAKNSKNPINDKWTETTYYDKINWVKWLNNNLNLGLLCGEASGITVIDIDNFNQDSEERKKYVELLENEKTLMQNSPNGKHYVFQYDKDISQKVNIAGLKIDTRNDGGQILIQPSKRDEGNYVWVNLGAEIKKISDEIKSNLLKLIEVDSGRNKANTTIKTDIIVPETNTTVPQNRTIKEGEGRNSLLVSLGGIFRNKFNIDDTFHILNAISKTFFDPPLDEKEIKAMIGSLSKYQKNDESTIERAIYEYMKLIQNDVNSRDIMESLQCSRAIIDKYLSKFVKEGKIIRLSRGRYKYRERIEWSDNFGKFEESKLEYKFPYFNEIANFQSGDIVLLGGRPKTGKCVSEGYLLTTKGLLDIKDIGENKEEGISKISRHLRVFTGANKRKTYTHPNYFYKEKTNKTIKIKTHFGYELEGTPEHPILIREEYPVPLKQPRLYYGRIFRNTGSYKLDFKELKDLKIGDKAVIICPHKFARSEFADKINFEYIKKKGTCDSLKNINLPSKLTPEVCKFLGYFVGDGSLQKNKITMFQNAKDIKNIEEIEHLADYFNIQLKTKKIRNCIYMDFYSSILYEFIRYIFNIDTVNLRSPNRFIPSYILSASKENQKAFIEGYFNCDSYLDREKSLSIISASEKLISQLHIMLLNFGIIAKKYKKYNNKYQRYYYNLSLSLEMTGKFLNYFNCVKYKNIKIPISIKSTYNLGRLSNQFGDIYYYDKIEDIQIKNEEKYVYDFNIESKGYRQNNRFWCNGFINHNTHMGLNFVKQLVEQGIKPYYIYSESGSRMWKIVNTLGLKEGDFFHSFHSNPLSIEIEPNSFTILDWLLVMDKSDTDMVFKFLTEEMQRKGGILVIITQLKVDYGWFAPNMITQFPALSARYIFDSEDGKIGHWQIDEIREPKGNYRNYVIPCEFDHETKILKKKDII